MAEVDKLSIVQALIGDVPEASNTTLLNMYIADAQEQILNRMYPFVQPSTASVPTKYTNLQCKLAARMILRRGAEGELSHSENGINRSYGTVNDEDLLDEVMQVIVR